MGIKEADFGDVSYADPVELGRLATAEGVYGKEGWPRKKASHDAYEHNNAQETEEEIGVEGLVI